MSDIFISYAREDKAKAEILAGALEDHGFSVWWDPDIPLGTDFSDVLEEELDKAKCVVVLWSKTSVKSRWVKDEAAEGHRQKKLVPVKIEDVKVPLGFRGIQTASLIDWKRKTSHPEFEKLLEAVSNVVHRPPSSPPSKKYKVWKKIVLSLVILITLVSLTIYFFIREPYLILTNDPFPIQDTNEADYTVSFRFKQSERVVPGIIDFIVRSDPNWPWRAKIKNLKVSVDVGMLKEQPPEIADDKLSALLIYEPVKETKHILTVTISKLPARLEVFSKRLKECVVWNSNDGVERNNTGLVRGP